MEFGHALLEIIIAALNQNQIKIETAKASSFVERAYCLNAHKLLYCPMALGVVVFRNEKDLNHLKTISQYVNRPDSVDTGRFTIEGSRPFACLKPWASLKIIGRDGYRLLFGQAQEATSTLKRILEESRNFEILNHPELFILNYRLVPKKIMEKLNEWAERKLLSLITTIEKILQKR